MHLLQQPFATRRRFKYSQNTHKIVVHTGFSCWFRSFCHSFSFFHFLSNCFSVISTFFPPVCLYLSVNLLPLKSQKDNYKGITKWEIPFEYTVVHLSLSLLYVPEQQYSAVKAWIYLQVCNNVMLIICMSFRQTHKQKYPPVYSAACGSCWV